MHRLSSYRDFDWILLGFVLLLSIISVLEIKSATLHTKFHGFETKQIGFLARRPRCSCSSSPSSTTTA